MRTRLASILTIFIVFWTGFINIPTVSALPGTGVSVSGASDVLIGTSPVPLTITFDNTAPNGAGNIGYAPFLDVYFPASGVDGATLPLDGLAYIPLSATYLGEPVTETILTFPAGPLGGACAVTESAVAHPYAPVSVCGIPGDTLVVFLLPLASLTPDQPPVVLELNGNLSNFADADVPLTVYARGGYRYDAPAAGNPFFSDATPASMTDNPAFSITPRIATLTKTSTVTESETVTGPNSPHTYTITTTVAPGQTITNYDIFDYVDDNIVITSVVAPGASSVTLGGAPITFPAGPVVANGTANRLVVTYLSISGTVSTTINYFIPLRDAGGANVVNANNGASSLTENRANGIGDFDPLDPRDPAGTNNALAGDSGCPACLPNTSQTNRAIQIQKTVTNLSGLGNIPGDVLEYTLNIAVSDFFALDNVSVFDVISDGQRLTGNPIISYTQHGIPSGGAMTNFAVREYFAGGTPGAGSLPDPDVSATAGDTVLAMGISAELALDGFNEILGGCVLVGGTGGGDPDCVAFNGGATTLTITYQTTIQDSYTDDFPSGDASLDMTDSLDNVALVRVNTILNTTNLAPTGVGANANDTSTTNTTGATGTFTKDIIAVNEISVVGVPTLYVNDLVTFRLRMTLPSSDFENLSISDFLPAPIFNALELTTFNNIISNGSTTVGLGIPAAGQAMWGATGANNFATLAGAFTPTIITPGDIIPASCGGGTIDANENTLMFCFGDYDSLINIPSTIDILFSVTMTANPFPANFVAGNLAQTSIASTQNNSRTFDDLTRMILNGVTLPPVTATKTIDGTSEAHTDDGTADTNVDPRPVAVGEVITYRLVTEMPEGTSPDVQFTDTLAPNVEYIAGSARISYSANNAMNVPDVGGIINEINPTTIISAGLISFGVTGPRELRFNIGSVTNNDVDVNAEILIIEYQVVVVNTADNTIGGIFANDFETDLNNDGTDDGVSNEVFTIVHEPVINLTKFINTTLSNPTGTTSFDAGDTVIYDILVTVGSGANMTTAFDLQVTDGIDPNLDLIDVDFIGTPAYATTADNSDYAMPVQAVNADISELRAGDIITIRVTTTVRSSVTIGQVIPNSGTVTWTSLPNLQGSGNATPGASGATNGERNGSGGENDYTATNAVNFTALGTLNTLKTIDGTSEGHTNDLTADTNADPRPVAVGEVITYRLVVEMPEGISPDVQFTDTLAPNIEYIAGSARMSYSANNAMNVPSVGGILNEINPTTTISAGLISFGVTGPRELRFDIGSVTNNDTDNTASAELLIIEYQAVVVNTADNTIGAVFANDFEIDLNNDGTDDDVSNEVFNIVQEPVITATKAIFGTPPTDALEPVTYDIVITAGNVTNQQNAYDINLIDIFHPDLSLDSVVIQTNPGYVSITADASTYIAGGTVNITLNRLDAGDSVTIRVTGTVLTTVSPGETIGNSGTVTWTSLPGAQGTGNATPGASGTTTGERNGSGGENDYTTPTNTVNFTLSDGIPDKFIDGTSETSTPDTADGSAGNERPVAIGEIVTYRLQAVIPESTTISFRIDDDLPAGLQFVTGSARVSYLADATPSLNGDFAGIANQTEPLFPFPPSRITLLGGILSFDFSSIINNDGDSGFEFIIIEFDAVVLDVAVPANNNGVILPNDFDLVIDEGLPTEVNTPSNSVGVIVAEPALNITKTFTPDTQVRGGATTMTLTVSNLASDGATAPIHDLRVTDILDDWLHVTGVSVVFNPTATTFGSTFTDNSVITAGFAAGITDNLDIVISGLPIDGTAIITVNLAIDPNADTLLLSRTITNIADVTGDSLATDISPDDQDRAYSDNATDNLNVVKPTLLLTKTDSIDPVSAGDSMAYTVTIQNTGTPNFSATNVVFTDQIPAGFIVTLVTPSQGTCVPIVGGILTCNIGTIGAGSLATVVITGYYPVSTPSGTIANNIAYVTSTEGNNGNDGNDTPSDNDDERAEEPTTILRQVDVEILKTVDDPAPSEGDTITYTLSITNNGPAQATNVIVTDSIPAGVTFVQFLPISAPCVYAAPTITCTYPTLNVGQTVTVDIEATVDVGTSGTVIPNTANVTTTEPETNLGNNDDDVDIAVGGVDLAITKTVDNPAPSENDTIVYSINLENMSLNTATTIVITDLLPAGVTYVSHVAPLDSASVLTSYVSGTGIWSIGQLNAGATITLQITATVNAGTAGTSIPNTASLTSLAENDGNPNNNTSTAIIGVDVVDIEVIKTVSPLATSQGNPVTYTVTVTNIGTVTATGVIISENVPMDGVNTTYVSHTASQGTFTVGAPGLWNIGTLTAGQSVTLDLTVTIEIAGGQINNTATLTAINETDVNPANNSDSAIVTVGPNADLSLTKTISDTTPQVGDVLVYTLTITNAGPDSTDNVVVTDTLPPTVTYAGVNTASQGTFDGTLWTVGTLGMGASAQLDITVTMNSNGGTTTNVAEVTASDLPDPDSIPNNGVTTEDDYAEVAFLFDPPFGRKTFNDAGLPELEWTVVWVNPSNAPIAVTMSDPLLDGTTFVAGSLTCTSPGTIVVNTCIYDALNNEIVFDGTIFPDTGATPATIDSATNRLIITYRVTVPNSANTVSNIATLNTTSSAVAVSNVFNRSTGGTGETPLTAEEIQAKVTALPATGESPMWADTLRVALLVMIPIIFIGVGGYWWWRKRSSESS